MRVWVSDVEFIRLAKLEQKGSNAPRPQKNRNTFSSYEWYCGETWQFMNLYISCLLLLSYNGMHWCTVRLMVQWWGVYVSSTAHSSTSTSTAQPVKPSSLSPLWTRRPPPSNLLTPTYLPARHCRLISFQTQQQTSTRSCRHRRRPSLPHRWATSGRHFPRALTTTRPPSSILCGTAWPASGALRQATCKPFPFKRWLVSCVNHQESVWFHLF